MFPPAPIELTLEIGCGHGHWLVDFADAFPERQCLGIDIVGDRIERANRKKERAELENARFLRGEAMEVLDAIPEQVILKEVFILFPDPWPKKRHWKNRLFGSRFLDELAARSKTGARCYFRTDHEDYFAWAEEVVAEQTSWWRDPNFIWPFERETVFQSRAESYRSLAIEKL